VGTLIPPATWEAIVEIDRPCWEAARFRSLGSWRERSAAPARLDRRAWLVPLNGSNAGGAIGHTALHNPAQIVSMEGDRRIITELNGNDVTNCVIAEDVNDDADRARAECWLFLGHLIANAKFRCKHRTCSERFKCRPNGYINDCCCTLLQKYRDNCPWHAPSRGAGDVEGAGRRFA